MRRRQCSCERGWFHRSPRSTFHRAAPPRSARSRRSLAENTTNRSLKGSDLSPATPRSLHTIFSPRPHQFHFFAQRRQPRRRKRRRGAAGFPVLWSRGPDTGTRDREVRVTTLTAACRLDHASTSLAHFGPPSSHAAVCPETTVTVTETIACQARGVTTEPRGTHPPVRTTASISILVDTVCEPHKIAGLRQGLTGRAVSLYAGQPEPS